MTAGTEVQAAKASIEFWFEFGSPYSYLSVMRIQNAARRLGVTVSWKPFLLGPIFKAFGWSTSPFVLEKERGAYMWKDVERRCRKYGIPWRKPSSFPRRALLPMRVALLGVNQPWMEPFCRSIMQANFVLDREIDREDTVSDALKALAVPVDQVLAQARSESTKASLRRQTEEAQMRGVFGAPTFFVKGEMYWGDDRLDDALEHAAAGR